VSLGATTIVILLFGYSGVIGLWTYTFAVSFGRLRALRKDFPIVARLYSVIMAGSVFAIAIALNDVFRVLILGGIVGDPFGQSFVAVSAILLSLIVSATALAITLVVGVRGLLPQLAQMQAKQREEFGNLQELVEARTQELRETVANLERDAASRSEVEELLRAEHAMLEAIMETSVGAVCVVSVDGHIIFANDTARTVLGIEQSEITSRKYNSPEWKQTDKDGNPLAEANMPFNRVLRAGAPVHDMETVIEGPDGKKRMLRVNGAPLRNADGGITSVVMLVSDVTQQVKDEGLLQNSERRFRVMVENLPSGAIYVEGDQLFMNRAAEEITGYSRNELNTVNQWFWALYGQEASKARAAYEANMDAGFPVPAIHTIRRKDGSQRTVQFDCHRSKNSVVWIAHDITDQYRMEEELRASEAKYRLLAETARDMICVHDLNGRLTYHNEALRNFSELLTGRSEDLYTCGFLTPASRERVMGRWEQRLAGDRSRWLYELDAQKQDGTIVPLEVSAAPIEQNGKIIGSLSIMRDVSQRKAAEAERRRLEEQLHQTQKLESLAVFASGIAHDFNNLLMGVLGNTDLVRNDLADNAESRNCLDDISQSAKRAAELCRMLLALAGEGELRPEPVDVNEALQDSIRFIRAGLARGVQLHIDTDDSLPLVQGDSAQLHQMLLMMIAHATSALDESGGNVIVRTGVVSRDERQALPAGDALVDGAYVSISVSDDGAGMSQELLSRIFEPFFSMGDKPRGLGLALALGIARAHGGTMTATSTPGKGTCITAYLASQASVSAKPVVAERSGGLWHGNGKILVVDDEENVRAITKRMLERLGFEVLLASDGQQAVELVEKMARDLSAVILDLTMPIMDGDTAFQEIRRMEPMLPVLIASGYDVKTVTNRFDRGNVSSFIQKPFQIQDLAEHLRDALDVGLEGVKPKTL